MNWALPFWLDEPEISIKEKRENSFKYRCKQQYGCQAVKEGIISLETYCHYVKSLTLSALSKFHESWVKIGWDITYFPNCWLCHQLWWLWQVNTSENQKAIYIVLWGLVWKSYLPILVRFANNLWPMKNFKPLHKIQYAATIRFTWQVAMSQPWDLP